MTLSIDTDAASRLAESWSALGESIATIQFDIEDLSTRLALDSIDCPSARALAGAANELWCAATFVVLAVEAVLAGDRIDLNALAAASHLGDSVPYSPGNGELGQTLEGQVRSPYTFVAGSDAALGVAAVFAALEATASIPQIRSDEFQIVKYGPTQYMIVLPGVADLSNPDLGLSEVNATVRDTDRSALRPFLSEATGIGDGGLNPYGRMVRESALREGVPPGSDIVIVGHSFGAATALELAADEVFASRYHVTHVVAAAYDAERQLDDVLGDTQVLVLQNHWDLVVQVERLAGVALHRLSPMRLLDPVTDPLTLATPIVGPFRTASGVLGWFDDEHNENGLILRFNGGLDGAGHAQSNYLKLIEDEPAASMAFFAGVAHVLASRSIPASAPPRRRRATGTAKAIDVSVPDS